MFIKIVYYVYNYFFYFQVETELLDLMNEHQIVILDGCTEEVTTKISCSSTLPASSTETLNASSSIEAQSVLVGQEDSTYGSTSNNSSFNSYCVPTENLTKNIKRKRKQSNSDIAKDVVASAINALEKINTETTSAPTGRQQLASVIGNKFDAFNNDQFIECERLIFKCLYLAQRNALTSEHDIIQH